MNKKILSLFLILCPVIVFSQIEKQHADKYFRTIAVDQGLSQNTVFAIAQDALGFMWMGTQNGLNRYDGEVIKVYRPVKNDTNSLQSYYIRSLFTDRNNRLWIGGNKGISYYDHRIGKFKNYALPIKTGEWHVTSIASDQTGKIWASTSYGDIYFYDINSDRFLRFTINNAQQFKLQIKQMLFHKDLLYIGTSAGTHIIDLKTKKIRNSLLNKINSRINYMLAEADTIWLGTEGNGLYYFDVRKQSLGNFRHKLADPFSLVNDNIRSLEKDNEGNLWIGTFKGLSILNMRSKSFKNYLHQPTNSYTISQNSIRCIYRDRQNGMWLGTFFGGTSYYHKDDIKFNLINQYTSPLALNDQVVNVIKEDADRNVWIGTNDKGLNIWNRRKGTISYYSYKEDHKNSISSDNIKSIEFDAAGNALIGTHNSGLNYINKKTGQVTHFNHDPGNPLSISGNMVQALLKDSKNRIWVGTWSGLNRFHPENNTFSHYYPKKTGRWLSSDRITFLKEDSKGRIWIGTVNGVNIFHPESNQFEIFKNDLSTNNLISSIAEDKNGRIWIGTKEGLVFFNENTRQLVAYKGNDNVTEEIIYSLQSDNEGNLWVSTNNGLLKLNFSQKKTELFDNSNSLGKNQFSLPASCKTTDGMILFGGLNGLCYFYPQFLVQQPYHLNITFTGLELLNTLVIPNDLTKLLQNQINEQSELKFQHDYKQFTLYFNAFNYISPNKISYYFKLTGFDTDWQKCESISKATYSNLNPGTYLFRVKAVGPLGETSRERLLTIKILPPWWNSGWFYLMVCLIAAATGYLIYRIASERLRTRHQLKVERLEREKLEYISKMKTDFFTNISHEFRTPLTLIIAPLEEMLANSLPIKMMKRHLKLMLTNAQWLYNLVDQLLESRKTELETRKLKLAEGNLVSVVHKLYALFIELAERNQIKYTFYTELNALICYFDEDAVEKIVTNLLSNSFKYTPAQGEITMTLKTENGNVVLTVTDTGTGIAVTEQQRIFDRFYQVNPQETNVGSGIGLAFTKSLVELHQGNITVQSTLGHGASFIVTLPLNMDRNTWPSDQQEDHFEPENMESNDDEPSSDGTMEKTVHLLIIDDNYEIVDYMNAYFSKQYKVYTAYNATAAFSLLEETAIDLIICDVMMPGTDGINFCRKIKKNINTSHIPVILLTARHDPLHQVKGFEAGADDYTTKPFSILVLDAKVRNILRSRKRLKEYYSNSTEVIPENIALNSIDEAFLKKIISIIEDNITDSEFSVAKLGEEIGMSRSNLHLKLKAITDESTIDFIRRIRFKKAVEYLESKRYNVAEVAYKAGFSSPSYFSTTFKQYFGCLPSEYCDMEHNQQG